MSKIFVKPIGGLCNRLRVIDSLLTFVEDRNQRLVVIWEKNTSLNCSYSDLFELNDSFELIETRPKFRGLDIPFYPSVRPVRFHHRALFEFTRIKFGLLPEHTIFFDDIAKKLQLLSPITPEKFGGHRRFESLSYPLLEEFSARLQSDSPVYLSTCWRITGSPSYSRNFKPSPEIAKQVSHITGRFTEYTCGIHIRGTDAVAAKRYSSVSAFDRQMESTINTNPEATFFLACDEPDIKQSLIDKYPSHIFFLDQQTYDRSSPKNIENALVDLLCLASTQRVFGSYFSTFSQLAADWHGVEEFTVFSEDAFNKVESKGLI